MNSNASKKEKVNGVIKALIAFVVGLVILKGMEAITPRFISDSVIYQIVDELVFASVITVFVIIYRRSYIWKPDLSGIKGVILPGLVFLIPAIFSLIGYWKTIEITDKTYDIVLAIIFFLLIGVAEESLFRGILQNAFHDYFGEDTRAHVIMAIVLASLIFGAMHLTNAFSPDIPFSAALSQAVGAAGLGLVLGTIYFRAHKCIWVNVILHAINDGVAFVVGGMLTGKSAFKLIGGTGVAGQDRGIPAMLGGLVLYLLVFLVIARKKKIVPLLNSGANEP